MGMKDKEVTELAKANSKWDYKKVIILSVAVAISVFVLFSAFSIAKGKIDVDTVKNIRESGNAVAVYLENAGERQYDQMIYPDYVEDYGWEYSVGDWNQEGEFLASCKVIDQTVWEKMIKPACGDITGNYPKAENEIMLSRRLLDKIGISDPETGMKITVQILFRNWSVNGGEELTEEFVLSGYYTDYTDSSLYVPTAYFSEKYLDMKQIPRFPAKLDLTVNSQFFSSDQLEKWLYRDIEFYKTTPVIIFDTVYEESQWKVISCFEATTDPNIGEVFDYFNFVRTKNEERIQWYIDEILARSFFFIILDLNTNDKFLTI